VLDGLNGRTVLPPYPVLWGWRNPPDPETGPVGEVGVERDAPLEGTVPLIDPKPEVEVAPGGEMERDPNCERKSFDPDPEDLVPSMVKALAISDMPDPPSKFPPAIAVDADLPLTLPQGELDPFTLVGNPAPNPPNPVCCVCNLPAASSAIVGTFFSSIFGTGGTPPAGANGFLLPVCCATRGLISLPPTPDPVKLVAGVLPGR
jgi:hypothetical protein